MADRRKLMRELRGILSYARNSRPDLLEAFEETCKLAEMGETMTAGLTKSVRFTRRLKPILEPTSAELAGSQRSEVRGQNNRAERVAGRGFLFPMEEPRRCGACKDCCSREPKKCEAWP